VKNHKLNLTEKFLHVIYSYCMQVISDLNKNSECEIYTRMDMRFDV